MYPGDLVRSKNWGTEILTDTDLESQLDLIINWIMAALDSTTGHAHEATSNKSQKINVGTGLIVTSQAQGDVLYASSATAFARLAAGTKGKCFTTGGAAANPTWEGMTTQGDIEYHDGTNRARLAKGTALQLLRMNAGATAPEWSSDKPIKGWVNFNGTGAPAIRDSYNVSGAITDNGTGDYTITWDTDFADVNYCVIAMAAYTGGDMVNVSISAQAVGSIRIICHNSAGAAVDPAIVCVMATAN